MVETCFGSSKFPRFIDFLQQVGSEVWSLVCRDFFWNTHPCKHLYQIIINLAGFNSSACPQEWHTKGHLNGLSLNGLTLLLLVIGKLCLGPLVLFPFPPPDLPTITETELGFPVMYPFFWASGCSCALLWTVCLWGSRAFQHHLLHLPTVADAPSVPTGLPAEIDWTGGAFSATVYLALNVRRTVL